MDMLGIGLLWLIMGFAKWIISYSYTKYVNVICHTVQEQRTATPRRKYKLRGGVSAKTCVLSFLSRVSHSMNIALSQVLLSFSLLPFSMNPTATNSTEERGGREWAA